MSPKTKTIIGAITALSCCNIALGMTVQLVPLVMDAEHDSKLLIGLNTTIGQLGVLISGFSLPYLARRFQGRKMVLIAVAMLIVAMVGFAFLQPRWGWFAARFLTGLCISILFTTSEMWIQSAADDQSRARVMGLYMSMLTVTFGVGPFLIPFTGFAGPWPWFVGMGTMAFGFLVMSFLAVEESVQHQTGARFLPTLAKAPLVFICVGFTTLFEAIMLSFFTLYAIAEGLSLATATSVLGFGIAACLLFFYPIGQLADRWSRRGTICVCAGVAIVCCLLQPYVIASWLIWPLIVLLRAGAFGSYLNGFAMLGDTFKGAELITASALVSILWGVGGLVGPPLTGYAIDHFGIWLLPLIMASCYVPVLIASAMKQQDLILT